MVYQLLRLYLLLVNGITFCLFGIDKRKAVKNRRRIREAILFLLSALGGTPGALLAMYLFRHKTQKPTFFIGIPLMLMAQIALLSFLMKWL